MKKRFYFIFIFLTIFIFPLTIMKKKLMAYFYDNPYDKVSIKKIKNPIPLYFYTTDIIDIDAYDYSNCFFWTKYSPNMAVKNWDGLKYGQKNKEGTYYLTIIAQNGHSTYDTVKLTVYVRAEYPKKYLIKINKAIPNDITINYGDPVPYKEENWHSYFKCNSSFKIDKTPFEHISKEPGYYKIFIIAYNDHYSHKFSFNIRVGSDTSPYISLKDKTDNNLLYLKNTEIKTIKKDILSKISIENSEYDKKNSLSATLLDNSFNGLDTKKAGKYTIYVDVISTSKQKSNSIRFTITIDTKPEVSLKKEYKHLLPIINFEYWETPEDKKNKLLSMINIKESEYDIKNNKKCSIIGIDDKLLKKEGSFSINIYLLSNLTKLKSNTISLNYIIIKTPTIENSEISLSLLWNENFYEKLFNTISPNVCGDKGLKSYEFLLYDNEDNKIDNKNILSNYKKVGKYRVEIIKLNGKGGHSNEIKKTINVNITNNEIPKVSYQDKLQFNVENPPTRNNLEDFLKRNIKISDEYSKKVLNDENYILNIINDSNIINSNKKTGRYLIKFNVETKDGRLSPDIFTTIILRPIIKEIPKEPPKEYIEEKEEYTKNKEIETLENQNLDNFTITNTKNNTNTKTSLWDEYKTLFILAIIISVSITGFLITFLVLKYKKKENFKKEK